MDPTEPAPASPVEGGEGAEGKTEVLSNANGSVTTAPFDRLNEDDDEMHMSGLETPKEEQNGLDLSQSWFTSPADLTDRVKTLAPTLQSIPELTLDEASHVRNSFTEVMGERENITNTLELRVLLGDLGFYPPEKELQLLLQAYRNRVNLSGLIRFLRFYKKDYPTTEVSPPKGDVFAQLSTKMGGGSKDPDAMRAFIFLGGEEDGTGTIRIDRLQEALQEYGVTVEFTEEVLEREEIDFSDFCGLWQDPKEVEKNHGFLPFEAEKSSSFSTLNPQTPGAQSLLLSRRASAMPRRMLSLLGRASVRSGGSVSGHSGWKKSTVASGPGSNQDGSVSGASRPRSPAPPTSASLHNDPITQEERAQLLCMYLFPERYETRRTRFTLPERKQQATANSKQPPVHHRLARDGSLRRRRPMKKMFGWKTSTHGQRKDEESDEEDFLTQKNGGVYRPPSPMILSLRNSTAYKKHQRLQDQKRKKEQQQQQQQQSVNQVTFNSTNSAEMRAIN